MKSSTYNEFSEMADDESYDEEYDEEYYDEEPEERTGLFSTPARTIALMGSLVLLLVVAGSIAWLLGRTTKDPKPPIGDPPIVSVAPRVGALAPDFTLVDVNTNKPVQLSSLRGKPVLVNFWGTWCPPCREEMPALQNIYNRVKNDVAFVGVSMGPRDEPMGVNQFVKLNKYTWTFVHDADTDAANRYQVQGVPSTYFIDKNGIIRAIHVGGADEQLLDQNLQKALNSN